MLNFTSIKVSSFDLDNFVITWSFDLKPVTEDINKYQFFVQRSNSPNGPFDELNTSSPLIDTFTYTDTQINRLSKWRHFFYRVRAVNVVDAPLENIFSEPAELIMQSLNVQRRQQLEIIRLEKILLQGVGVTPGFVGIKCLAFIRRSFGQRCTRCWDPVRKKVSSSQCETCFGVGFERGYFDPIVLYVNFSPDQNEAQLEPLGEVETDIVRAWTSNFPILSDGDIIIDPEGVRWRVKSQTKTQILRRITRQSIILYYIQAGDIEYKIPFNVNLLQT